MVERLRDHIVHLLLPRDCVHIKDRHLETGAAIALVLGRSQVVSAQPRAEIFTSVLPKRRDGRDALVSIIAKLDTADLS
jgi:hypothetical protein